MQKRLTSGEDERRALCVFWLLREQRCWEGRRREELSLAHSQPMSEHIKREAAWPDVQRASAGKGQEARRMHACEDSGSEPGGPCGEKAGGDRAVRASGREKP